MTQELVTPVQARTAMTAFVSGERRTHLAALLAGKPVQAETFFAAAITDAIKQPKLALAIRQAPETLIECLSVCAASGLLPGAAYGQFFLTPRWNGKSQRMECTFIVGYKGLCDVAYRHERVHSIEAHVAFVGDEFRHEPAESRVHHVPNPAVPRKEFDHVLAAYTMIRLTTPNGQHVEQTPMIDVMWQEDLRAIRDKTDSYRAFLAGKIKTCPWVEHAPRQCRKTVLRRHLGGGSVPRRNELAALIGAEVSEEERIENAEVLRANAAGKGLAGLAAKLEAADEAEPATQPREPGTDDDVETPPASGVDS